MPPSSHELPVKLSTTQEGLSGVAVCVLCAVCYALVPDGLAEDHVRAAHPAAPKAVP